ncbi:lysozyme 2-like isoform X2 [Rhodnius prolixus]
MFPYLLLVLAPLPLVLGQLATPIEPVSELCLGCICEAASNCNRTLQCNGDVCGIFRITWAYWADANKPTLDLDNASDPGAYARCVNEPKCAANTVVSYMNRFAQDCNNDGLVNCWDYARIHKLGGYGCKAPLNADFDAKFTNCQRQVEAMFSGAGKIEARSGGENQN